MRSGFTTAFSASKSSLIWLQAWGKPHEGAQFRLTLPRRARFPLRHSPLPLVPEDAAEVVA